MSVVTFKSPSPDFHPLNRGLQRCPSDSKLDDIRRRDGSVSPRTLDNRRIVEGAESIGQFKKKEPFSLSHRSVTPHPEALPEIKRRGSHDEQDATQSLLGRASSPVKQLRVSHTRERRDSACEGDPSCWQKIMDFVIRNCFSGEKSPVCILHGAGGMPIYYQIDSRPQRL